ncbi:MAG: ABC transporter ATP-binding protein [Rhodospirillaceae bacterium]|nr:ABC transporter ATP-binding protein [Rhodospirillaceae bacterium]
MISVRGVSKKFGGLQAVDDCTLDVAEGSLTGLIGPNGAGKSTLFNMIAGVFPPTAGKVFLDGEDVTGQKPHRLFRSGLVRTFQIAHEYANMPVIENLMVVPAGQQGESLVAALLQPGRIRSQDMAIRKRAEDVLDFLRLTPLKYELAGNLSGGQKKLLELGRTMMTDARVVLLDEVGAGVNRALLSTLTDHIERLNRDRGYTFFVIEHDMELIGRLCDPVIVMAQGAVLTQGTMADIRADKRVVEAYLGHSDQEVA